MLPLWLKCTPFKKKNRKRQKNLTIDTLSSPAEAPKASYCEILILYLELSLTHEVYFYEHGQWSHKRLLLLMCSMRKRILEQDTTTEHIREHTHASAAVAKFVRYTHSISNLTSLRETKSNCLRPYDVQDHKNPIINPQKTFRS